MDADWMLGELRALVIEVDQLGTIRAARGAVDGIAGYVAADLVGLSALDIVADSDRQLLIEAFTAPDPDSVVRRPLPFPLTLESLGGRHEVVDVLATGTTTPEGPGWVVLLTPRRLHSAAYELIDAVVDGAPLVDVARAIAVRNIDRADSTEPRLLSTFVLMDAGTDAAQVISSHAEPGIAAALLDRRVTDAFERAHRVGSLQHVDTGDLPEPFRSACVAAGFEAAHIGRVGLDDVTWWVVWLVDDRRIGRLTVNADLPRREMLRIATYALERERVEQVLRVAATTDPLTGLRNRAFLAQQVGCLDDTSPVSVIFIDLDRFKSVNDRFGHAAGDDVLCEVGRRIVSAARPDDVVARMGGDEFVVLLPATHHDGASVVSERIAASIAGPIEVGSEVIYMTASAGVAAGVGGGSADDLLRVADSTMMLRKYNGRRTEVHSIST